MINKKRISFIILFFICIIFFGCEPTASVSETESKGEESSQVPTASMDGIPDESKEEVIGELMEVGDEDMETFSNFIMDGYTENAWQAYGFGDPFVMRYNGKYYLYSSTKDGHSGIKVWSSDDLVNWDYGGFCATDVKTTTAYAPEVTYYNGSFYMYTSPNGQGHYVLKSSSPYGPFKIVTKNLGNSIDGHVFIDDNGTWFFYHAAHGAISGKEMTSPLDISQPDIDVGVSVSGGWTEGPMVIKNNGTYYLTYCGNHVWSKGYRIEGAVGASPLQFNDVEKNILLLNTDYPYYGLGHSSTVKGPNMDTYYIVYHSFSRAARRRMHIDLLAFNGNSFSVLGPTSTAQQMPQMPDIYTDSSDFSKDFNYYSARISNDSTIIEGIGYMITKDDITSDKYTAEINLLKAGENTGLVFSYVDENNYAFASVSPKAQTFTVSVYKEGKKIFEQITALPKSFGENYDFTKLQAISVKKEGYSYTFSFNGLTVATYKLNVPFGKLGIMTETNATVGYTAISFEATGSSLKTYYKSIDGEIPAITCVEDGETVENYKISYEVMKEGYVRNYYVNVNRKSLYDVEIMYYAEEDTILEMYQDKKFLGTITLLAKDGIVNSTSLRNVQLEKGFGVVSFKVIRGKANIRSYTFTDSTSVTAKEFSLDSHYYKDGMITITDDTLYFGDATTQRISHGKVMYGDEGYGDYAVEADFTFSGHNKSVGIILRGKNPAMGGAGDDSFAGKYFFQGYHVCFDNTKGILIYKVNYERGEEKISFQTEIKENVTYNLRVEAIDNIIKIYLDGKLLGEFEDNYLPFQNGAVGITGLNSVATVKNIKIEPISSFSEE